MIIEDYHGQHAKGVNGFDPDCRIDGLDIAIRNAPMERASFIWNKLLVPNWKLIRGTVVYSGKQDFSRIDDEKKSFSKMGELVTNIAWIPTTSGPKSPYRIDVRLFPEGFVCDRNLENAFEMRPWDGISDEARRLDQAKAAGMTPEFFAFVKDHEKDIELIKDHYDEFRSWNMERRSLTL